VKSALEKSWRKKPAILELQEKTFFLGGGDHTKNTDFYIKSGLFEVLLSYCIQLYAFLLFLSEK